MAATVKAGAISVVSGGIGGLGLGGGLALGGGLGLGTGLGHGVAIAARPAIVDVHVSNLFFYFKIKLNFQKF